MLACDQAVTVVKLVDGERYEWDVFCGVSWFNKTRIRVEGTGVVYDNAVQIRIPAGSIQGQALPAVGDHVIHGGLPEDTVIRTPAQLAKYKPLKVLAVGDNRRGGLPHVAVIGK